MCLFRHVHVRPTGVAWLLVCIGSRGRMYRAGSRIPRRQAHGYSGTQEWRPIEGISTSTCFLEVLSREMDSSQSLATGPSLGVQ